MIARYYRNFAVGTSTHVVQLYAFYTDEQGLASMIDEIESTRMNDILKDVKGDLTQVQVDTLRECMREKMDVIVLPDGKIGR